MKTGKVLFVGAGPGDPTLVTLKGMAALQQADVVIFDRLVHPGLLAYTRHDARLIYAGKEAAHHVMAQAEINRLLVEEARRGQVVVRLKGGDPGFFGRVGEEAQACREAGIPFDVIPGVTSGTAAPMYAGIPLTHRDYHSSVTFLTGHRAKNAAHELNWAALAALPSLVIYMGVKNLPVIQQQLLAHGMAPDTPVAVVRWGTVSRQQTVVGQLGNIDRIVQAARIQSPAIIVIGDIVRLREELNWYETKPLFGTTVACAVEAMPSDNPWTVHLASRGAEVIPVPLTPRLFPPAEAEQFIQTLPTCRWLVFGNRRQVDFFFQIITDRRWDVRQLTAQLAACGEATADSLRQRGLQPAHVLPAELPLAHLRRRLAAAPDERIGLLLGHGEKTVVDKNTLVLSLGRLSWDDTHPAARLLASQPVDWLAASDPDHLDGLAKFVGDGWQERPLFCSDVQTAQRAQEMGWKRVVTDLEGLLEAAVV